MKTLKISKSFDGTIIYLTIDDITIQVKNDIEYYTDELGLNEVESGQSIKFNIERIVG